MTEPFVDRHVGPRPGDVTTMLERLGYESLDALMADAVPPAIRSEAVLDLPPAADEATVARELRELAAHNQYLACAIYYDALTMPRMAGFFYRQAEEERGHALMMVQYLVDTDESVVVPAVPAPRSAFGDLVEPVQLALDQERAVTDQINGLLRTAREESDYASEQFLQWFIKEQVEEVATMSDLLAVVTRNRDDVEDVEEYVARELGGEGEDPTAPRQAGA